MSTPKGSEATAVKVPVPKNHKKFDLFGSVLLFCALLTIRNQNIRHLCPTLANQKESFRPC